MLPVPCGSVSTPRGTVPSLRYLLSICHASSSGPRPSVEPSGRPTVLASSVLAFPARTEESPLAFLRSGCALEKTLLDSATSAARYWETLRFALAKSRGKSAASFGHEEFSPTSFACVCDSRRRLSPTLVRKAPEMLSSLPPVCPFCRGAQGSGFQRCKLPGARSPLLNSSVPSFSNAFARPSYRRSLRDCSCRIPNRFLACSSSPCSPPQTVSQRRRVLGALTTTRALSTATVDSAGEAVRSPPTSASASASSGPQKGPVLAAHLRQSFPYVMPVFRPLQAIKQLPMTEGSSSRKALELRTLSVRLAHALLPPFSSDTEELWCIYTRRLLVSSSASSAKEEKRKGETRKNAQQSGEQLGQGEAFIPVSLGLQIARLFASRNVTLSESWRLLFSALDWVLVDLQKARRREGLGHQVTKTGRDMIDASGVSAGLKHEKMAGDQVDEGNMEEVIIRLSETSNRVRHDWRWGTQALVDYAKRELPLLDVSQAAR
ncbi:atp-dependent clp protease proteolytic protein [Cystoisospora suis]|uniref:Atp-dependent clp protease proteolytic protein n=1 Tax=Cystoisospora suis TaxID=483139 RepID=A0A2C6L4C9_9APIC|nr:atp-dependent clp protease proteolytic protein [Cystoisospora suis]